MRFLLPRAAKAREVLPEELRKAGAVVDVISAYETVPASHKRDEVLERIYIGRRFKNDTERLEKLFDLYTKMTAAAAAPPAKGKKRKTGASA